MQFQDLAPYIFTLKSFTLPSTLPTSGNGSGAYAAMEDFDTVSTNTGGGGANPDHARIINAIMTYSGLGKGEVADFDANLNGASGGAQDGAALLGTVTVNHATAGGNGAYFSTAIQDVTGGTNATFEWARAQLNKNRAGSVARGFRLISGGSQAVDQGIRLEGAYTDAIVLGNPPDGTTRAFDLDGTGKFSFYGGPGRATAGLGVPPVYAVYSTIGNAALVTNAINYVPTGAASAGTYRISAYVNVRTAAAVNMNVTVGYKDGAGVARSETMPLNQQASTNVVLNMNNVTARFTGSYIFQIDNSVTAITLSTTGTTMTLYDLAATLEQLV